MEFRFPLAVEAFRTAFRTWLDANITDEIRAARRSPDDDAFEVWRRWNRTLADAGYGAIAWPVEYGGRGASLLEQVVYAQELDRADAPGTVNLLGISNIAPAIMDFGTEAQKRAFLPRMLCGDDVWCQGMSEPNAGSDLAALRCRAVRDGDDFVVTGQKTWTTLGHRANWCQLYVRTDPDAPKHKGITCLLVDMTAPGVTVRPLTTISGGHDFNEVFFDDVRVPATNLLGPLNGGWKVAMTTLSYERAGVASLHLGARRRIERLRHEIPQDDVAARRAVARLLVEVEHLKLLGDRAISSQLHGKGAGAESSLAKLAWSLLEQSIGDVACDLLGADGMRGEWAKLRLESRAYTIAGGTTQVNKNIVAQHILGLPRG